ncbi:MAG: ATP-grasp domain-containing protein [Polyangiaceae bacterium]
MGHRVHTFSPDNDTPTGQVADLEVQADYADLDSVRESSHGCWTSSSTPAEHRRQRRRARACAHRRSTLRTTTAPPPREDPFLNHTARHARPPVRSLEDLRSALAKLGCPAVLKTAGWGYDGKGQVKIERPEDADSAFEELGTDEGILEAWVPFEREVSVVAARDGRQLRALRGHRERAPPPHPGCLGGARPCQREDGERCRRDRARDPGQARCRPASRRGFRRDGSFS